MAAFEAGTGRTRGRDATRGVIPGRYALSVGHPGTPTPPEWRWTELASLAQLESGHTPSRRHSEYWNGGIPWVGIKDATQNHGRTITTTYQNVSELGLANSSARLLPAGTVCLSRTASVGYVIVMGVPMATSQDFVNWVCGPDLEAQFLKYALLAEGDHLLRFASGTTHQTIYYPEAKALHILLPPLHEQQAIATILGALDDKIELNRRMNQTLEEMAQAIFRSWFGTYDLQEHQRSVESLIADGDLEVGDGYRAKREELADTGIPFARAGNIDGGFKFDAAELLGFPAVERAGAKLSRPGDIVFTSKGTVGRFAFVSESTPRFAYSPQLCYWRALSTRVRPAYLYFWMRSPQFLALHQV